MKCETCGSTLFTSVEDWKFQKVVYINLEGSHVWEDSDEDDSYYLDGGPWKCENGHAASHDLTDRLYKVYTEHFG